MMNEKMSKIFIFCVCLIVVGFNGNRTHERYKKLIFTNKLNSQQEPGHEFRYMLDTVKGMKKIGYLTNRDFSGQSMEVRHFLSAQYMLAPTLLDVGNADYPYVILDGDKLNKKILLECATSCSK